MSPVMVDPTNEWYTTRQQSAVTARPRRGVVLHHGATTSMDAILQMETSGSRQVSSNRVAKNRRLARVVSDDPNIRAWSLSSPYWDSVLSSCECANESTAGWTISAESQETIAQWVAFKAQQEGWWPSRSGAPSTWTVFGHREIYVFFGASYASACPGGMDLDWITERAQQLLTFTPTIGDSMPTMMAKKLTATKSRFIMTDGNHKATTEDQTTANNWVFAFLGGNAAAISQADNDMKIAAFAYLDALQLPSFGVLSAAPDVDEAALAAELAKVLPAGITKAQLDAAVKVITTSVAGVPAAVIVEQKKPGN